MLDLLAQHPILDFTAYILLLFVFHWCVFRGPRVCLLIAIVTLLKVIHTFGEEHTSFFIGFNVTHFALLCFCLYLCRNSPNYFWLFSGLIAIKVIDICSFPWALQQGVWFFVWTIILDGLVIVVVNCRSSILYWIANKGFWGLHLPAKRSAPYQRLSYQEVLLMLLYWVSIIISVLAVGETLIRIYTDWFPTLVYYSYPHSKFFMSLFELVILFNIACGHAVDFYSRKRVW